MRDPVTSHSDDAAEEPANKAGKPRPMRRAPLLKQGDRVALISPGSHQGKSPPGLLARAAGLLEAWGLVVEPRPEGEPRHLFFAGPGRLRAETFQRYYLDPGLKALFVTRGGYGTTRMLPLLDRRGIAAAPPKHVVGFSDATALLAYLNTLGIIAIHGPNLAPPEGLTDPARAGNEAALRDLLFGERTKPRFGLSPLGENWNGAVMTGRLIGGNLSVWATTIGTPWETDSRGAILFLEDVDERPYRIDRMLTHLRTAGKLEGLHALVFGRLHHCDSDPPGLLDEVLRDLFADTRFPVFTGMPAGHGGPNRAFPLGAEATISADAQSGFPVLTID